MASGTVSVTRPANPPGAAAERAAWVAGPAWPGAAGLGVAGAGAGVLAEEQVEVGAGAQLVHAALQPGLLQLLRPGGDLLIGGQHLVRGSSQPISAALPESSAHRSTRASLAAVSRRSLAFSGAAFDHRAGDRGAQPARGQPGGPVQDLLLGGAGLVGVQERGGARR